MVCDHAWTSWGAVAPRGAGKGLATKDDIGYSSLSETSYANYHPTELEAAMPRRWATYRELLMWTPSGWRAGKARTVRQLRQNAVFATDNT